MKEKVQTRVHGETVCVEHPSIMQRWRGKLAIVTGASSGIGAAIAEALVKEGLQVVGLARRVNRVQELAKTLSDQPGKLHAYQTDITKEEDILQAFKYAIDNFGPIHILINNAGVARPTNLIDGSTEDFRMVLETNLLALSITTREAVQSMLMNNVDGHIVHINSVFGHYVPQLPLSNVYPASKHGVTAMTETLRQELFRIGKKIKVTSLSPGYVKTEISKVNGFFEIDLMRQIEAGAPYLESKDIADGVIYVLGTPPNVQVTELTIRPTGEPI